MILAALVTILIGLYLYIQYMVHRKKRSFKKRNIPLFKGRTYLLILKSLLGWNHQSKRVDEIYWLHPDEDAVALVGLMAQIIIRNPDYIERILIKDFASFHDRVKTDGQIKNPMDANMFLLTGNTWRTVRHKFSPLFTSGKLRFMYEAISDCGKELSLYLAEKDGQEVDMCDVLGLFGMDVTGSTTYGIEPHVLKNPDSEYRKAGKELVNINFRDTLKAVFMGVFPKIRRLLGLREKAEAQDYFCRVVRDTLKYREEGGFARNDFVQMLLALKRKRKVEMQITDPEDDYLRMEKSSENFDVELTDDIIIGGAFIFLVTGFHITPMSLAFTLLEIARRPEVVHKMREEIDKVTKGKTPTYDQLRGMRYCENVIKEAMRLHPVATNIQRLCTKEYTLPNGGIIEVGESILIPTQAIQMDPAYWPEPEVFSPERFDVGDPRPGTYLPFGEGPRMCIAMRFVMLQMKSALVTLIRDFDFTLSEKNQLPIKLAARLFSKTPADGIIFHVKKRNSVVKECD